MQFPRLVSIFLAVAALAGLTPAASGQTTAGAGSVVIIPQVASLATYVTTVFVRNPSATTDITVNVRYYLSNDTATPPPTTKPWLVACSPCLFRPGRSSRSTWPHSVLRCSAASPSRTTSG